MNCCAGISWSGRSAVRCAVLRPEGMAVWTLQRRNCQETYGAGETLYRQPLPHTALQLKERTPEVKQKQPQHYYVCCGKKLTACNISEIYQLFSDYMDDAEAVVDLMEIDRFLHKKENADILERHYSCGWNRPVF